MSNDNEIKRMTTDLVIAYLNLRAAAAAADKNNVAAAKIESDQVADFFEVVYRRMKDC